MASPFSVFRSNLKPLMVVLTLLSLFAFVVLPAIQMYLQYRVPGQGDMVVATYNGGSIDMDEVSYYQALLGRTNRYLAAVAEQVQAAGGVPQVPGYGPVGVGQNQQMSYGISVINTPTNVVLTKLFAREAEKLGLDLDDTAIDIWMARFTNEKLSARELASLRARTSQNTLGESQMYALLKTELLANMYERLMVSGLATDQSLLVSPVEAWQNFLKLNQQAKADAYPILVEDFLDKTGQPSEETVLALYEEGKDRFPSDMVAEPGFARYYAADIEYVAGDIEKFIEAEVAKLSEDEIRAEYERRLAGGEFQMPPLDLNVTPPPVDPVAPENNSGEATETGEANTEEKPAAEDPAAEQSGESPATGGPQEGSSEEGSTETPAGPAPAADQPAGTEETPGDSNDDSAALQSSEPQTFVSTLIPQEEAAQPPAEEPPAEEPPAEEPPAEQPPAEEPATEAPATQEPAAEQPPAETPPATEAATETPASETPATDAPAAEGDTTPPAETPAEGEMAEGEGENVADDTTTLQPQSFEQARDQVARDLVLDKAREARDQALLQANNAMRAYSDEMAYYRDAVKNDPSLEEPVRPDLKALAEKFNLDYGKTGLIDAMEALDMPIGQSRGRSGQSLVDTLFTSQRPEFYTVRTSDTPTSFAVVSGGVNYVAWKVESRDTAIPKFDEVREEVVAAAKRLEARDLARQAAEELAKKANESPDTPLADLVPENRKNLVFSDLGPFPWMQFFGFGNPIVASVPELDNVGEDFMQAAFRGAPVGQYRVAPNRPKSVFYVVRTTEITPPAEELRPRFMQSDQRAVASMMAGQDMREIRNSFEEKFRESVGLEWNEEALR